MSAQSQLPTRGPISLVARIGVDMTSKQKALAVINSLGDNVSLDDVIDQLYRLRKIELGMAQADARDVMEHEEFMVELEREDAS